MPDPACKKKIEQQKPPFNRPCPKICAEKNFIDGTHCKDMGLPPDTPFLTQDPDFDGPGKPGWCYCCCSCLTKNTPLEQSPGEFVFVQDVNEKDQILVAGQELKWEPGVVKKRTGDDTEADYDGMYVVFYRFPEEVEDRRFLVVTPDQLFLRAADRTLKAVQHLIPGDKIARSDGSAAEVIFAESGRYRTAIHTIEMEGPFDGSNLDGHLINANGVVTTDYVVQAYHASHGLDAKLLFAPGQNLVEVGEKDYIARFPSKERDAFVNDKSAWPPGFSPQRQDLINIPADAKGFLSEDETRQVLDNGTFVPYSNQTQRLNIFKLFGYMRAVYTPTIYLVDWNNDLPNAYSWIQTGQRFVLITGGLARFESLFVEGISVILACVQARLDGAPCIGDADYEAVAYGLRKFWPDAMLPPIFEAALDQIQALFKCIVEPPKGDVCEAPTPDCRIETYKRAISFMGIPNCAKPVQPFDLVSACARNDFSEVLVTYSLSCEVATATTTDNYEFTPRVQITSAAMNREVPNESQVILAVSGLNPQQQYMLRVHDVLSATGAALNPNQNSVKVSM